MAGVSDRAVETADDGKMRRMYVWVLIVEAAILLALWGFSRHFSA